MAVSGGLAQAVQLFLGTGLIDVEPQRTRVMSTAGLGVLHVGSLAKRHFSANERDLLQLAARHEKYDIKGVANAAKFDSVAVTTNPPPARPSTRPPSAGRVC